MRPDWDAAVTYDVLTDQQRRSGTPCSWGEKIYACVSGSACQVHGLEFEALPIGSYEPGDGARLLRTADSDTRSWVGEGYGGLVILTEGWRGEQMLADVTALVERLVPRRVAVVCLGADLRGDGNASGAALPPHWRVRVLGREQLEQLGNDGNADAPYNPAPRALARELIAAAIWAVRPRVHPGGLIDHGHGDSDFSKAIGRWLALPQTKSWTPVLAPSRKVDRFATAVADALWRWYPEAPWFIPVEIILEMMSSAFTSPHRQAVLAWLSTVLPLAPNHSPEPCILSILELLLSPEPGIVVTPVLQKDEGRSAPRYPALTVHRWVTEAPLNPLEQAKVSEAVLDVAGEGFEVEKELDIVTGLFPSLPTQQVQEAVASELRPR